MELFASVPPKINRHSFAIMKMCSEKLLHHQLEGLEKLMKWFQSPNRGHALVSMPTGSGKTGVMCCLPYFLGSIGLAEQVPVATGEPSYPFDKPILVITPGNDIADQLEGQILTSADDHNENFLLKREIIPKGVRNKKEFLPNGKKVLNVKDLTSAKVLEGQDVIIANVQKFPAKRPASKEPEDSENNPSPWWGEKLPADMFRLVIVDEAHHVPAPTWQRIIKKFSGHALVVFFTATPFRTDGQPVVYGDFAYHLTLQEARERGIIRDTCWEEVDTPCYSDLQVFEQVLMRVKEIQDQKNEEQPLPGGIPHMAIAITKTREMANEAVKLWNANYGAGTAIAYHGGKDMKPKLPLMMGKIKSNEVKLVVVVAMLMEGFDHSPISIAAILTKISSPLKFVQFVGRAQRVTCLRRGKLDDEVTPPEIAHIVSHKYYDQEDNYFKFEIGQFVEPDDIA